jgi:hypothetical protein
LGRRKMSWQELRERGCKPGRWEQRKKEQEAPLEVVAVEAPRPFTPDPDGVASYVAAVQREWDTFAKRCVSGEVLTRQHGAPFDYGKPGEGYLEHGATYHFAEGRLRSPNPDLLQQCKDFAEANQSTGEWTRELSTRFLVDISTLNEFVFDVEACKNVERMLATFAPDDDWPMLRKLATVEFMSWKHRTTGESKFDDAELVNFNDDDIRIMDRAFSALQQATAA